MFPKTCSKHNELTRASYENKITGSKEHIQPAESLGGILADDMGLGKTLTVLATIIRTTSNAKAFAGSNCNAVSGLACEEGERLQIPSRATLVVVPSPSMTPLPLLYFPNNTLTSTVLIDGWEKEIEL